MTATPADGFYEHKAVHDVWFEASTPRAGAGNPGRQGLAGKGLITAPDNGPFRRSGVDINCPAISNQR